MRPVEKGPNPGPFSQYRDAMKDLEEAIGPYCSYCEKRINNAPEVEHVQPKSLEPALTLEWDNFLIGCKNCNGVKSNRPVDLLEIAFPDTDNPMRGLVFEGSRVSINPELAKNETKFIEAIIKLVKLHRHPANIKAGDKPTAADNRYLRRGEVWDKAMKTKSLIAGSSADKNMLRELAVDVAIFAGHFSVWITVFADDTEMKRRLVKAFPGTAENCFDDALNPVRRPGGKV